MRFIDRSLTNMCLKKSGNVAMLLSIIIPVYNLEHYIVKTLDALLNVESDDYEVIVINDGSSDASEEIVRKYITCHPGNKILFYSKDNGGVSSARNYGVQKAHGEYLLYLDGDDSLAGDSLNLVLQSLRENKPDILFWPFQTVNSNGKVLDLHSFKIGQHYQAEGKYGIFDMLKARDFYLVIGNAAYKRSFIIQKELSFTEGCVAGEDMEFTWKCLASAQQIRFIPGALLQYVQRETSTIHNYNIKRFDSIAALERTGQYLYDLNQNASADLVIGEELVINYIGTYRKCLEQKMKESKLGSCRAVRYLNDDIDREYPDLRKKIDSLLKSHCSTFPINRVSIFSLSPILYMRFAQANQFVQKIRLRKRMSAQ